MLLCSRTTRTSIRNYLLWQRLNWCACSAEMSLVRDVRVLSWRWMEWLDSVVLVQCELRHWSGRAPSSMRFSESSLWRSTLPRCRLGDATVQSGTLQRHVLGTPRDGRWNHFKQKLKLHLITKLRNFYLFVLRRLYLETILWCTGFQYVHVTCIVAFISVFIMWNNKCTALLSSSLCSIVLNVFFKHVTCWANK